MFRLDGKTALVTGASGGIGAAIARDAARPGRDGGAVRHAARGAGGAGGASWASGRMSARPTCATPAAPDALVAAAEAAAGPLRILVNNAGFTRDMLALRMKDEDWQAVLDVDLTAPFRLARAALRGMLRRRAGRIVSISSIVGSHRQCRARPTTPPPRRGLSA